MNHDLVPFSLHGVWKGPTLDLWLGKSFLSVKATGVPRSEDGSSIESWYLYPITWASWSDYCSL